MADLYCCTVEEKFPWHCKVIILHLKKKKLPKMPSGSHSLQLTLFLPDLNFSLSFRVSVQFRSDWPIPLSLTGHFSIIHFKHLNHCIIKCIPFSWVIFPDQFSSVQFSRSVLSDPLWPHGLQHTRPPCPSPTPRVYSNSCPLSWWYHPSISPSVIPSSSSRLQSFPASGYFPMSQFFAIGEKFSSWALPCIRDSLCLLLDEC